MKLTLTTDRRASRPMTIRELADAMGLRNEAGRKKLLRYLLRAEKRKGVSILTPSKDTARGRYTVTIASLRRHCPELVDEHGELAERQAEMRDAMQEYTLAVRTKIERLEEQVEDLGEQVGAIMRWVQARSK